MKVKVTIFAEYLAKDRFSNQNAVAIRDLANSLPCAGRINGWRIDPASGARTSIGPAAFGEYEKVLGRNLEKAPSGRVADGLDFMECLMDQNALVIHPRCTNLIAAFQNYRRAERNGEYLNEPAMDQSPHEDMIDSTRYIIKSLFPSGIEAPTNLTWKSLGHILH
jgi:hypothetical protein